MSSKANTFKEEIVTEIGANRRGHRRYDLDLNLQYKILRQYRVCQSGSGKTVNLSGGGLAIQVDAVLSPGATIELAIAWPVRLNKTCPLKLVVTGKVVRSTATMTAVRMDRYEFHTQGARTFLPQQAKVQAAGYSA